MKKRRRVLVIGSGGREAVMVWKLSQDPYNTAIFCAPGNPGMAQYRTTCIHINAGDIDRLLDFIEKESIDLTIVGPEAPLVAGIVDQFNERFYGKDMFICGPRAKAAQAEGSKFWFKRLLTRHGIPTAEFDAFGGYDKALECIRKKDAKNIVIKADGLMGGKGVFLPSNMGEAESALKKLMEKGGKVVIEDRLVGVERSAIAATDSEKIYVLPFTQDYKRVGDGDEGPNTGGMGARTLSLSEEEKRAMTNILRDVIVALNKEGCTYSGFIYLGFIMTADGPMVLECNIRLGDPEAQVILSSTDCNFAELCMAIAKGELFRVPEPVQNKQAVCVVLTSAEYPSSSNCDDEITGLIEAMETGALVFHAGTGRRGCNYTTNKSGRIISIVGVEDTLKRAQEIAYNGVKKIRYPGIKYRRDIGGKVV